MHCKYTNKPNFRYPCGGCVNCRINKAREWTGRLLMEQRNPQNAPFQMFVTLTYDNGHLPADGHLQPDELNQFIRSTRSSCGQFRYFAVGEYGEEKGRPHYHLLVYPGKETDINNFTKSWTKGRTQNVPAGAGSLRYVAGYCVKGLSQEGKNRALKGAPEFARMSKRPGLGFNYIEPLALQYETASGSEYLAQFGDICRTFTIDGQTYPLGKTMRTKLRERLDIPVRYADRIVLNPRAAYPDPDPDKDYFSMSENAKLAHIQRAQRARKNHGF